MGVSLKCEHSIFLAKNLSSDYKVGLFLMFLGLLRRQ